MASVRFSDVVRRVNKFVDRHNTDLLYYVGGEHMESQELLVRQKGLIKGATIGYKFHFGFEPGHILFGSRNPHLKKCSMVDFAGVCSDSTYVVETRDPEVLDQRYLLLEMQSDRFWDWAEENKSGSVNYLINYCTLDEYEFDLPPIEKQRELAELLWAANDLKEAYRKAIAATDEMLKAKFREMFGECGGQKTEGDPHVAIWPLVKIGDVSESVQYGTSKPGTLNGDYKYLRMNNLTYDGLFDFSEVKRISLPPDELETCFVCRGDILFNRTNTKEIVGKTAYFDFDEPMVIAGYIIRLRVDKAKVSPQYLWKLFNTDELKAKFQKIAKGSIHQANINAQELRSIEFPLPPLSLQREFMAIAEKADETKAALKKSIADLDQVMRGLINE